MLLELTAASSSADVLILNKLSDYDLTIPQPMKKKKIFWNSKTFRRFRYFSKGVIKLTGNETQEQRDGFLEMSLGFSSAR